MHRAPKTEGHSWALARRMRRSGRPEAQDLFDDSKHRFHSSLAFLIQLLGPVRLHCFFHFYDPLLVVFFRWLELGVGVWTEVKFPLMPYRLGRIENSPRVQARQPRRFCIVSPWATEYHTVQCQVYSCDPKRNRLLGCKIKTRSHPCDQSYFFLGPFL